MRNRSSARYTRESHASRRGYGSHAAERIRHVGEYVKDRTSEIGQQIQHGAERTKDWFTLGLIGGLVIPTTKHESRILGPSRDRLINQAHAVGSEILEKGEQAAERAVESVKSAVSGSDEP
jgi:hypothetical protein